MTINELGIITRRSSENISIIDLTITSPSMGDSITWSIPGGKYSSISNHKLIIIGWEDLAEDLTLLDGGRPTNWDIKNLVEDDEKLKKATAEWKLASQERPYLLPSCSQEDLKEEVSWLEDQLIRVLDSNARINYVTSYSKRWFNEEVKKARRDFGRASKQARRPGGDPEAFR